MCEANFYVGEWHLPLEGQPKQAWTFFQQVEAQCPRGLLEYQGTAAELKRMERAAPNCCDRCSRPHLPTAGHVAIAVGRQRLLPVAGYGINGSRLCENAGAPHPAHRHSARTRVIRGRGSAIVGVCDRPAPVRRPLPGGDATVWADHCSATTRTIRIARPLTPTIKEAT